MALKSSQVVAKNCLMMGILGEDDQGGPHPTKTELDAWIQSATTPNTWVLNSQDPQVDAEVAFGTNVRDTWVQIDLSTMKVLKVTTGNADESIADLLTLCQ